MGRDVGEDRSGDEAAWNELVARLELPLFANPATAPWPARENLGDGQPAQKAQDGTTAAPYLRGSSADRSRVIRPAGYRSFGAEPAAAAPPGSDADALTRHRAGPDNPLDPQDMAYPPDPDYPDYLAYDEDDLDDRYIPPPIPPLPKLDPVARGAWTALFGGPAYLFLATMLSWQVPGWAELGAIVAFVAGFTILVVRLGDGPSKRDGPDQGAVV